MQLQHQFDAFDIGLAVLIEEEHAGVIDQHIDFQMLLMTPLVEVLGSIRQTQIRIMRYRLHAVLLRQVLGYLLEFLLLIRDQQQVGLIVACQLGGVLKSYTATCSCY